MHQLDQGCDWKTALGYSTLSPRQLPKVNTPDGISTTKH
jgi:hypothetical protein